MAETIVRLTKKLCGDEQSEESSRKASNSMLLNAGDDEMSENLQPLNEDDAEKIRGMIKTLVRYRRREAANNRDTYRISNAIEALSDLHDIKGWGEIK